MKKVFVVIGFFILLMLPAVSFSADRGPYLSAHLGLGFLSDSDLSDPSGKVTLQFDPGFATTFAGGYKFGLFRLEGEIGYQANDIERISGCAGGSCASTSFVGGDVSASSLMANAYFDFANATPFTPFITVGLGIATLYINDLSVGNTWFGDSDDTVLAYQLGAGLAYAINKKFSIDFKYRYFTTQDPEFDGLKSEFKSHNVYVGVRYHF